MKKEKFFIIFPIVLFIAWVAWVAWFLTFVLTFLKVWFSETFFSIWIKSFIPTVFIMAPLWMISTFLLSKFVDYFFKKTSELNKKIILAILMWCVIEFVISFITIISSKNYDNFMLSWLHLYLKSLPLWFIVWIFMSFVFKPWMSKRIERLKMWNVLSLTYFINPP